jgi:hypothetical protein
MMRRQYDPSDPRGLREPFPVHPGQQNFFGSPVRSPVAALVIGSLVLLGGLVLLGVTISHLAAGTESVTPWVLAPIVLIVLVGGGGVFIGIVRVQWSKRYRRATGQPYRREPEGWRDHVIR